MNRIEQLRQRVMVVKCQIGERSAWDALYRQFNPALGYYLRRLLGDGPVADDLRQEVWLTVVRKIGRLKAPEAFTVWLYRIARGKAMTWLKTRSRDAPLDDPPAAPPQLDEGAFSPADAARVHAGLAALRAEHRDVLLLRFMEDLSYEQIAEVVGCGIGTVRSRIHYAKCALRRELEKDNEHAQA